MRHKRKDNSPHFFTKTPTDDYEEISEKKTSKLGYFLLFLMSVCIFVIGEAVFFDLADMLPKVERPSHCVTYLLDDAGDVTESSVNRYCTFSKIDKKFAIDTEFNKILPSLKKIAQLNTELDDTYYTVQKRKSEIQNLHTEYDLSLQEKIAHEAGITNKDALKETIRGKNKEITFLQSRTKILEANKQKEIQKITPAINRIAAAHDRAKAYYERQNGIYELKVFLLMLGFILPFFLLSVYVYMRLKRKNSPYTIIFTAIVSATTLLFLQVVCTFLYHILPKEWLAHIFALFKTIALMRYILYYGVLFLVIGIFGGLVFYIQKKVFSAQRIALRRLKDNKCPGCSFTLNAQHAFCPKCGQKIKEQCTHCGNQKIRYLAHCPYCGTVEHT